MLMDRMTQRAGRAFLFRAITLCHNPAMMIRSRQRYSCISVFSRGSVQRVLHKPWGAANSQPLMTPRSNLVSHSSAPFLHARQMGRLLRRSRA